MNTPDIFELLETIEPEESNLDSKPHQELHENVQINTAENNSENTTENSTEAIAQTPIENVDFTAATLKSFHLMTEYIKYHKTDIPEPYRGTSTVEPITNLTLAMYWIHIMKTAPIPKWMMHNTNVTDSHGWTLAIHYIVTNLTAPPEYLQHDPTIQTSTGKTALMMYLLYRTDNTELIPSWMIHSDNIRDNDGYNIDDYRKITEKTKENVE